MSDEEGLYHHEGIEVPETPPAGTPPEPWGQTQVVGQPLPRVDGYERVSGTAKYPSDVALPGMLHAAVLRCPHPHARLTKLDTKRAETMPGVHAVLTGETPEADVAWPHQRGIETKLLDPHCRFEGEAVAAVAAQTPYQARDAVAAIEATWEVLPFTTDDRAALAGGAAPVHEGGNRTGPDSESARGDVAAGFAAADAVVERTFRTESQVHAPMEPHGCVASWDGNRLTTWVSTQGVFGVQGTLAWILGLPVARVRVVGAYVGGGFGSKLRPGKENVLAALLAQRTGRPVRLFLTREETFLDAGNRPPSVMTLKAGAKRDGTLTALDFTATGASGAYRAGGTSLLDWLVKDLYTCPNVRTRLTDVFIHACPARPMRAPGHPQGAWALEQVLDELAHALKMDPVALRLANVPTHSQAREGQPPYTTTGLRQCLEEGARAFGWREAKSRPRDAGPVRRGVGMAATTWVVGDGGPPATVVVRLFADGSVNLNFGASDIGTGTKTVMAMACAEELGVRPESIQIENADTGTTQFATPSGGSKTVPTEAPAVRAAAIDVKRQLLAMAAEQLEVPVAQVDYRGADVVDREDAARVLRIPEILGLRRRGVVVGVGHREPNPSDLATCPFGAQFCEVEVDERTAEVNVLRFVAAHESGRVMNRLTFDNQVHGGIAMGIGFGLTEARVLDHDGSGRVLNANLHDYRVPTSLDVPAEIDSVAIDEPADRANSVGAKGLGEPVTIPTGAALANAIFDAVGVRVTDTPVAATLPGLLLGRARKEG